MREGGNEGDRQKPKQVDFTEMTHKFLPSSIFSHLHVNLKWYHRPTHRCLRTQGPKKWQNKPNKCQAADPLKHNFWLAAVSSSDWLSTQAASVLLTWGSTQIKCEEGSAERIMNSIGLFFAQGGVQWQSMVRQHHSPTQVLHNELHWLNLTLV